MALETSPVQIAPTLVTQDEMPGSRNTHPARSYAVINRPSSSSSSDGVGRPPSCDPRPTDNQPEPTFTGAKPAFGAGRGKLRNFRFELIDKPSQ